MLDTLQLYMAEGSFTVHSTNSLQLKQPAINAMTGQPKRPAGALFIDSSGTVAEGVSGYANSELWQLDIQPRINGATVKFSVPRVATGHNFLPVSAKQSAQALEQVESELREQAGVSCKLRECSVSRLDTFTNIQAAEPLRVYAPILELLQCARGHSKDYGSTFEHGNKTAQKFVIYDKRKELEHTQKLSGVLQWLGKESLPNTLRFEHRLTGKRRIAKTMAFTQAAQLVTEQGLSHAAAVHKASWRKALFSFEPAALEVLSMAKVAAQLQQFRAIGGRQWLQKYLVAVGVQTVAANGIQPFIDALSELGLQRMALSRARRLVKDSYKQLELIESLQPVSLGSLYAELKAGLGL